MSARNGDTSLFSVPCRFVAGAADTASLPPMTHPEVALVGRSNVGKSSLMNALVGKPALARTSQHPGHTRQLNFFLLGERLMLVDMPGYGFARVSKQTRAAWDHLIHTYLCGRQNLKRVFLLVDARRGVMPPDEAFMEMLDEAAVSYQLVLTKCDAVSKAVEAAAHRDLQEVARRHAAAYPETLSTSALRKEGIRDLQGAIAALIRGRA